MNEQVVPLCINFYLRSVLFTLNIILGQGSSLNNAGKKPPKSKKTTRVEGCHTSQRRKASSHHMHIAKKTMLDPTITSCRNAS